MFDRNISDGRNTVRAARAEARWPPAGLHRSPQAGERRIVELTTDYPDALPVLKFANNDSLHRRM